MGNLLPYFSLLSVSKYENLSRPLKETLDVCTTLCVFITLVKRAKLLDGVLTLLSCYSNLFKMNKLNYELFQLTRKLWKMSKDDVTHDSNY